MTQDDILGCVLAGGLSRRMGGGDKSLRPLGDGSMLSRVVERLRPQVGRLLLNANGDPERFSQFGLPVVADQVEGFAGPLAGISAAMEWASIHEPGMSHIVTAASDTPFFPTDLVAGLLSANDGGSETIVMATSGGFRHPVFSLWPVCLRDDLTAWLRDTDTLKVMAWVQRHDLLSVEFANVETAAGPVDPFFNANTPEDLAAAEDILARIG
nr:molybdenum cofactor guanylyltransferase MobA [Hoeflea prorocentri]